MSRVLDVADDAAWWLRKNPRFSIPMALAVVAAFVVVAVSGGGSSKPALPATAAAIVGDQPIATSTLTHWQTVYTKAASGQATKPTAAQARGAAFSMLAEANWITQEAQRQKVSVSDAELVKAETALFAQYKGTATKAQVLQQLGLSPGDLRFQTRVSMLTTELQKKVAATVPAPSAAQIKAQYADQPARWAHPSKRDVRMVLTADQKSAAAALAALKSGSSFSTVSTKYTIDATLAQNGGVLKGITPGTIASELEAPIFAAAPNAYVGPLKTSSGWVVLKVQKIVPTADQTLAQATPKITQYLKSEAQAAALAKYFASVRARWKAETVCRATVAADAVHCPKA